MSSKRTSFPPVMPVHRRRHIGPFGHEQGVVPSTQRVPSKKGEHRRRRYEARPRLPG